MVDQEKARLRRENAELREELRQLRNLLNPDIPIPNEWGLVNREKQVFRALLSNDLVSQERLFVAVFGTWSEINPACLQSHISRIRSKLRPHGVVITTQRNEGYALTDRRKWKDRLEWHGGIKPLSSSAEPKSQVASNAG